MIYEGEVKINYEYIIYVCKKTLKCVKTVYNQRRITHTRNYAKASVDGCQGTTTSKYIQNE